MPRLITLSLTLGLLACVVEYEDAAPPGLDEVPEIDLDGDDRLVYERDLRWWEAPMSQRVRLLRRADGSYLLLRQRWQGEEVYGWSEGTLTDAGDSRLAAALAVADPSADEPVPGDYACTYADVLPATIHIGEQSVEYPSLCPPEGLLELASFYADVVELLLDCPLDPAWYAGEVPVVQDDCAVVE